MNQNTAVLESMPVAQAVRKQIVPAIASQMIALIYNLADTYFVGMLNDPNETAAITIVYSSFVMLTAISNLFGVGGASALSRALGGKKTEDARRIASISFWGGLGCGILFAIVFLILARPVLFLCGATRATYETAFAYARWVVVIGGPWTILNTLLANLVRAEGSAAQAAIGVSMGGILNIILDPFFVLPGFLSMGAAGAGLATAVSNVAATIYFLVYIARNKGKSVISISPTELRYWRQFLGPILATGFPSAVQYALTVVAIAAQSRFVAQYTTEAVAGLGIVKKLDQLPFISRSECQTGFFRFWHTIIRQAIRSEEGVYFGWEVRFLLPFRFCAWLFTRFLRRSFRVCLSRIRLQFSTAQDFYAEW